MTTELTDLESTFRCTHFACTLAVRHCLRRQTEQRASATRVAKGDAAGRRVETSKPVHAYCAGGTCPQGQEIASLFPAALPARPDPRTAPRMDIVRAVEEKLMPKPDTTSKPGQGAPCRECGSTSRHKKGCSKPARPTIRSGEVKRAPAPAAPRRVAPARPAARPQAGPGPEGMSVAELLELRASIDEELRARRTAAQDQLRALDAALVPGGAPPRLAAGGES